MNVPSLNGFLSITGARFHLFDLGTQVRKLPESILSDLDSGKVYPLPHLGFAWFVIFLWHPTNKDQNSFWFLKLPLDEQGILSAAVHSDLVNRLYRSLQEADTKERQRLLTDHPYQFEPDPEKMAALHAHATKQLELPASPYLDGAKQFYCDGIEMDWQTLGIQGIADLLCRATAAEMAAINNQLSTMDKAPAGQLIRQMEHLDIPTSTAETLLALAKKQPNDFLLLNTCLRGASQATAKPIFDDYLSEKIKHTQLPLETILLILTRFHHLLDDVQISVSVLDQLASQADSDGFQRVLTNLAMQPSNKNIVRSTLASPDLTENLANALSQLIQQQRHPYAKH